MSATESHIWVELADLFFLDTESSDQDFERVAQLLKDNGWTREQTYQILHRYVALHAAANFAYFLYPIPAPNWSGFNEEDLAEKIRRSQALRSGKPNWHFLLQDWWMAKILGWVDADRLLNRL